MSEPDPEAVVLRFVREINRRDIAAMAALMSPEIRFIDSLGAEVRGAQRLRTGFLAYFALFPDYRISVRTHFRAGPVVALFGVASGTLAKGGTLSRRHHWKVPAAWQAVVRRGRIDHWQVYADNTPVAELLAG